MSCVKLYLKSWSPSSHDIVRYKTTFKNTLLSVMLFLISFYFIQISDLSTQGLCMMGYSPALNFCSKKEQMKLDRHIFSDNILRVKSTDYHIEKNERSPEKN